MTKEKETAKIYVAALRREAERMWSKTYSRYLKAAGTPELRTYRTADRALASLCRKLEKLL